MLKFEELKRCYLEKGEKEDGVNFASRLYLVSAIVEQYQYNDLVNANREADVQKLFDIIWNYYVDMINPIDIFELVVIIFGEGMENIDTIINYYDNGQIEKVWNFIENCK